MFKKKCIGINFTWNLYIRYPQTRRILLWNFHLYVNSPFKGNDWPHVWLWFFVVPGWNGDFFRSQASLYYTLSVWLTVTIYSYFNSQKFIKVQLRIAWSYHTFIPRYNKGRFFVFTRANDKRGKLVWTHQVIIWKTISSLVWRYWR